MPDIIQDGIAVMAIARRVDLAREPDFAVGGVQIRPLGCELVADGQGFRLQPRVMQVLVALARADGRPVSREALVEACWGSVIVGDDALNRCIQCLRRLAEIEAQGAFTIETIPRVGYRLTSVGGARAATAIDTQIPLLAVLAFDTLSGDPELAWFSDGVSEEILRTVSRGAELEVIGRGSSFQFRGSDKAAAHVAATISATHVLDGSVRRDGSRVRIAAHLIECARETTLWSDRFDREMSDVFALQDEISDAVAAALRSAFSSRPPIFARA